ncbi:DgyrCDS9565 [Dimorphilus gyrociliatus]|uniref:DgyrCDS9565 n=1 Tax=Dimorphilus gyrociliatus TaxID=2664684 RepID=A0A7I8W029_9ANNE|nr:DgyrCDS9565 [Dimorphilus gyrociliatus]
MGSETNSVILVCGDVKGKFNALYNKAKSTVEKFKNVKALFCIGEFFGENNEEWDPFRKGEKRFPCSIYVTGPCSPETAAHFDKIDVKGGGNLAENVFFLGRRGVLSLSGGLRVMYLSGLQSKDDTDQTWTFARRDYNYLSELKQCDVLLTSQWPYDVYKKADKKPNLSDDVIKGHCKTISVLAQINQPRYHFSALHDTFYQPPPYRNSKGNVTRFISLANVGKKSEKWMYAVSLTPVWRLSKEEFRKEPAGTTETPYTGPEMTKFAAALGYREPPKRALQKADDSRQYFYDTPSQPTKTKRKHSEISKEPDNEVIPKMPYKLSGGDCWFCLSSPNVEKHLIYNIGTNAYAALAKGPLIAFHSLILPVEHLSSSLSLDEDTFTEIEGYKVKIRAMFDSMNFSVVFFERNYRTPHMQLQVFPIPKNVGPNFANTLKKHATINGFSFKSYDSATTHLKSVISPECIGYLYFEDSEGQIHICQLDKQIGNRVILSFGRRVLADVDLLNVPDRVDWRSESCAMTTEAQIAMASKLKKNFPS